MDAVIKLASDWDTAPFSFAVCKVTETRFDLHFSEPTPACPVAPYEAIVNVEMAPSGDVKITMENGAFVMSNERFAPVARKLIKSSIDDKTRLGRSRA